MNQVENEWVEEVAGAFLGYGFYLHLVKPIDPILE